VSILRPVLTASSTNTSPQYEDQIFAQSNLLLEHLRLKYSAAKSSRRIELFGIVFRRTIGEGEDPVKAISNMKEAFDDLNGAPELSGGTITTRLDDNSLVLAILHALSES
jgi:hypothetical protein